MSKVIKIKDDRFTLNCAERNVYGRICIYCLDEDKAEILAGLTGKKTLDNRDLKNLESLGFQINLKKLVI